MIIVLTGPDGCGKTTVADCLSNYINARSKLYKFRTRAYRFNVIPRLSSLLFIKTQKNTKSTHSGMSNPVHPVRLFPSFIYNCVDYFLGKYFFKSKNFIFARYYHDNYVQRSYLRFPRSILNFCYLFIPKPDYIFLLKRNPNLIYSKKPELTLSELELQLHKYEIALSRFENFIVINADDNIQNITNNIYNIVFNDKI
jgi:thymidylate kinase